MSKDDASTNSRRSFLGAGSSLVMGGGLIAGYGTLGVMAGRFLYPAGDGGGEWQYVATVEQLGSGESLEYTAPSGARVVVARQSAGSEAANFIALSSVCPHLGCQVHWESHEQRFFCPCHNGAFGPNGQATEGPPAKARQELIRFPLKVENGQLFIQVPMGTIHGSSAVAQRAETRGPRTAQIGNERLDSSTKGIT